MSNQKLNKLNLPNELINLITCYMPSKTNAYLPNELINLFMCYMPSKTNSIFKNNEFVKYAINETNVKITEEDRTEYLYEKYSFAQSYFIVISAKDEDHFIKSNIYNML